MQLIRAVEKISKKKPAFIPKRVNAGFCDIRFTMKISI